ncbi:YSIRK-type signal peptide-containing protein, partial [Streptococcus suis]
MSKKDMFRKEQRFSFRKFSFGLASAVIANVIFGGAIANSPVVHANTETRAESAETVSSAIGEPVKLNAATIPVSPEGEQTLSEENQASKQAENQEAATFDKTLLEKLILEADLLIKEGEKKLADNAELGAAVAAAKPVLGAAQAVFSDQAASAEQVAEQEEALRQASSKVGDQLALLSEDGNVTVVLTTSAATDDMIRYPSTADEATPKGYVRVEFAQGPYTKSGAWVWKGNPGEFRNAKKVVYFVKEGTTWGQLVDNPQFIFPEADLEDSDVVVGWIWNNTGYSPNIALQPRKKHQNSLVINSVLKPNVVYKAEQVEPLNASIEEYKGKYSEEDAEKWRFITFDAQGGQAPVKNQVNGSIVQRTLYSVAVYYQGIAYSNGEFTKRVFNPTLDKHTFVRWQTDEKKVLPKDATIISEDETYKALYIKHLDTQITVGNQAALKPKEKAAVEAAIRQANPDTADLIETITVNDNGSVVVTYKGGGSVTLPTHLNVVEDLETAKADANKAIDDAKAAALSAIEA